MKHPIWLDCDTGHDDAFAILLAKYSWLSDLIGVSTTHGNAPVHHVTRNTRAVLYAIGSPKMQVIRGADKPLSRAPRFAPAIHGESGLDGVDQLPNLPLQEDEQDIAQAESLEARIDHIAQAILAQDSGKPWIVATGPLTNIALLFRRHPQLAKHIAGLSLMGGAVGGGFTDAPLGLPGNDPDSVPRFGNTTPVAEFNIVADPEAAREIFDNSDLNGQDGGPGKIIMLGLDITHLCRGTRDVQTKIFMPSSYTIPAQKGIHLRAMFRQILNFFALTYAREFGICDGPPLHDPLAVWAVIEPHRVTGLDDKTYSVDVVIEREGYDEVNDPTNRTGQTVVTLKTAGKGGVRIPTNLEIDEFWERISVCISEVDRTFIHAPEYNPWTTEGQKHVDSTESRVE